MQDVVAPSPHARVIGERDLQGCLRHWVRSALPSLGHQRGDDIVQEVTPLSRGSVSPSMGMARRRGCG